MQDFPLGISRNENNVNFAFDTKGILGCRLLIYDKNAKKVEYSIELDKLTKHGNVAVFSIELSKVNNRAYMYEVNGKLLVDPYANKISGLSIFGERTNEKTRSIVSFDDFDWKEDKSNFLNSRELIIYKLHVRGFTMGSNSKVKAKGTYCGILEKINYLKKLGINALLLEPSYEFDEIIESDSRYLDISNTETKSKVNFWGYGAKSYYFSPKASYALNPNNSQAEFKELVKACHEAGIEVLMEFYFDEEKDIFFIDNCLRYWAHHYHVDGFKFVSASKDIELLKLDPYLKNIKLISYGWYDDNSTNLYECNDIFLVNARRFLRGDEGMVGSFCDSFKYSKENQPRINYLTDNNGFSLCDLFSYEYKHNEQNNEENRDGTDYNYSFNCGIEGLTHKKQINDLRFRMIKNAFMCLIFSKGIPLILAGDEFMNSKQGNNNSYCQDNEISYLDWNQRKNSKELISFVSKLINLRKSIAFYLEKNEKLPSISTYKGYPEISFHGIRSWYPDYAHYSRTIGIMLSQSEKNEHYFFIFNMHSKEHEFELPIATKGIEWEIISSSSKDGNCEENEELYIEGKTYLCKARSVVVLKASLAK